MFKETNRSYNVLFSDYLRYLITFRVYLLRPLNTLSEVIKITTKSGGELKVNINYFFKRETYRLVYNFIDSYYDFRK